MTNQEQIVEQLEALQQLHSSRGWAVLRDILKAKAGVELQAMRKATDAHVLNKHTHTYLALLEVTELPEVLVKTLTQQLQATRK